MSELNRFSCEIKIIDLKKNLVYTVRGRPTTIGNNPSGAGANLSASLLGSIDNENFMIKAALSEPIRVKPWKPGS